MQAFCNLSASLHNSSNLTLFRFVLCPDFVEIWWKLANWSKRSFRRKYYRKEWDSYTLMLKCLYLTQGKSIQTKTLNFTRSFTVLVGCSEISLSVISEPFFCYRFSYILRQYLTAWGKIQIQIYGKYITNENTNTVDNKRQ